MYGVPRFSGILPFAFFLRSVFLSRVSPERKVGGIARSASI